MGRAGLGAWKGRRDDGRVDDDLDPSEIPDGADIIGAETGFTDPATVLAVQKAILAHPAYGKDKELNLGPGGADGKWGPMTAKAVARINAWYTPGASATDNDGPLITDKTLAVLKLKPGAGESGGVMDWLKSAWSKVASSGAAGASVAATESLKQQASEAAAQSAAAPRPTGFAPSSMIPSGASLPTAPPAPEADLSLYERFTMLPTWGKVMLAIGAVSLSAGVGLGVHSAYKSVKRG